MYYDEYDKPIHYEPTIADEILMEYQDKMKNALLKNIKDEIQNIKDENLKLKVENSRYKQREIDILNKERDLKFKEDNLKREVINEFYKSNIGDTLKQYVEDCEIWFADKATYQKEKCNLCNKERELIAKFPNGETAKTSCVCAKRLYKYIPASSAINLIKFNKRDSRYSSDRRFYFSRSYTPDKSSNYYNDNSYQEFKIYHVVTEFNESIIELHENKSYGEKLGFANKDECQKYCNWLNSKLKC